MKTNKHTNKQTIDNILIKKGNKRDDYYIQIVLIDYYMYMQGINNCQLDDHFSFKIKTLNEYN